MDVYWDTACVLKLYCPETDSETYLDLMAAATGLPRISTLLSTELFFALRHKEARGECPGTASRLHAQFEKDLKLGRFAVYPLEEDTHREARRLARLCFQAKPVLPLRTLDGLHLATALLSRSDAIVTTDERLRAAARHFRLAVL
jgi:predicted nucleic acid-binding protein